MRKPETALPIAILLCFSCFTSAFAQSPSKASTSATAGLRIQLDKNGKVLQHTVPSATGHDSAPSSFDANTSGSFTRAVTAPATFTPTLIRTRSGAGTVVRLNGRFRAASQVHIDADGKLHSDCQEVYNTSAGNHN